VLLREAQEDNFHTSGTNQKYRYNGKELYGASLGWYDYGARYYDACLGRFLGVDPLAEKYPSWTAYHYVHNNPLRYDDPTGMSANDKIDVNKQTGNITVTPAAGNDEVRLVNDGKVENSYIYGKNGSFCKENDIQSDKNGTSVTMSDENKAQKFYEFAAQSNVEFGKLDVEKNGAKISVVITSHDEKGVGTLPGLVETFSVAGYTGIKQSHSHPDGQSVPSGHYDDNDPKNPYSLNPVPKGHKDYKTGDAQNARWTQSKSGFKNTKFEVYNPKTGSKTTYDGISKAKIHRK
jgi:RHS repeat-associated protein